MLDPFSQLLAFERDFLEDSSSIHADSGRESMKATLYQALGLSQDASEQEVRAALRWQIRKYYAKTRDGHGNVEEALRFINHASRILSDPHRRALYDQELAAGAGSVEQRIAHVISNVVTRKGKPAAINEAVPGAAAVDRSRDAQPPYSPPKAHHPGLTDRVASFRRPTGITIAFCTLFAAFIAAQIAFATPADVLQIAKQVLVGLTVALVLLMLVYGVVHGVAWTRRVQPNGHASLIPQADLAILNWRREKTVFLGTNQPQEDSSWVFQLRMAELERAKSRRTSEAHPWHRLGARLFDYALWGITLALPLAELSALGILPETVAYWLFHPLVAPTLITASWVPVEALLTTSWHTTPGKWLFGVYLQFSISDAYAERDKRAQFERALRRSFRVWWEGVGFGFPLLAPVLIAIAYEKLVRNQETDWDFAQDCLVTHGPPGGINTVTGIAGLIAMIWLYGVAWHATMEESITRARTSIATILPSSPSVLRAEWALRSKPISGNLDADMTAARGIDGNGNGAMRHASSVASANSGQRVGPPIDPDLKSLFAERQARIKMLKSEGLRMLEARNWRRAKELCRAWTDIELGNPEAWRCLGQALQAEGNHREAINALRKARQYDPDDRSLDAAITRSQRGILAEFLQREGH
jgi:hypothetical protein